MRGERRKSLDLGGFRRLSGGRGSCLASRGI